MVQWKRVRFCNSILQKMLLSEDRTTKGEEMCEFSEEGLVLLLLLGAGDPAWVAVNISCSHTPSASHRPCSGWRHGEPGFRNTGFWLFQCLIFLFQAMLKASKKEKRTPQIRESSALKTAHMVAKNSPDHGTLCKCCVSLGGQALGGKVSATVLLCGARSTVSWAPWWGQAAGACVCLETCLRARLA